MNLKNFHIDQMCSLEAEMIASKVALCLLGGG